jgi:hypothetical protein
MFTNVRVSAVPSFYFNPSLYTYNIPLTAPFTSMSFTGSSELTCLFRGYSQSSSCSQTLSNIQAPSTIVAFIYYSGDEPAVYETYTFNFLA